jgi:exopolyphosphatase/guanosine-5'-triphosphate,3'-diphosphate pyrophosphatase
VRAAVVDVGSNSIKLLLAERGPGGRPVEVCSETLEVRISKGIGSDRPRLSPEGILRGVAAVARLVSRARGLGADRLAVVATSAVRDASNAAEFLERVRAACGEGPRVLTGAEEAGLIGRGLTSDPSLAALRDFHVYDLGGGSLECLAFRERAVENEVSLPLGCVRLTERFVPPGAGPIPAAALSGIAAHVKDVLRGSGFPFPVPARVTVVGTGGTLTTVRAMAAAGRGVSLEQTDPLVPVARLREILGAVAALGLDARRATEGLSPERADVFPAALATLVALAEVGAIQAFHHSVRNLRWGVAEELLSSGDESLKGKP